MNLRRCLLLSCSLLFAVPGLAADASKKSKDAKTAPKAAAAKKAPALPEGVRVQRDLEYVRRGEKPMLLDLYLPAVRSSKALPVVVWVHGGGWNGGSKDKCPATWLVPEGFAVVSISYRLTTEAQWPAQMEDCRAAVRWVRANAVEHGLDANRIVAWGSSAGGHLVALMGTLPSAPEERVQAVIDWFGPTDLLTMPPNVISATRTREQVAKSNGAMLLGGVVVEMPDRAKSASALYQVSADDPPFLIMHGDADPGVPLDQSGRLHAALQAAGVSSTLKVLPGAAHGGPEFATPESRAVILEFLRTRLGGGQ